MTSSWYSHFIVEVIRRGDIVHVGEWQSQKVEHPSQAFVELTFQSLTLPVPPTQEQLANLVGPDLPWAEDHFEERVSGYPLNPPPSEKWWPWRDTTSDNEAFTEDGEKFSHTYPERYWPKKANVLYLGGYTHQGIRYRYGDLGDVVDQLNESPLTRQAYLPVWFPEDTGAVQGQRVPCSLGYHFLIREGLLHCAYYIRSCDVLRHFRNDVYLTARLMQWVSSQLEDVQVGELHMYISSLHCFLGDIPKLHHMLREEESEYGSPI